MEIVTQRLILRTMNNQDFKDVHEYMSDEKTMNFFVDGPYTKEKTLAMVNPKEKQEHLSIILKDNQKIIGHLDFHTWEMINTYEIGWVVNKNYQNKGYATEAVKALINHAFNEMNVHRLVIMSDPRNETSNRICQKLGFRLEGTFKKCIYNSAKDEWWDELFYAMLKEEYHEN